MTAPNLLAELVKDFMNKHYNIAGISSCALLGILGNIMNTATFIQETSTLIASIVAACIAVISLLKSWGAYRRERQDAAHERRMQDLEYEEAKKNIGENNN